MKKNLLALLIIVTLFLSALLISKVTSNESPNDIVEAMELSKTENDIQKKLGDYLTSLEENRNFSGQVLVEKDGKIYIDRSYGLADYEENIQVKQSTTFAIGSVTKQFTAAAIVQLVEQGKIAYEDKVSKYLTNIPHGDEITIHQLLTHTSGLMSYTEVKEVQEINSLDTTFEDLIAFIKDKNLNFEPGTSWSYCNTGYLILGRIVEEVSGETLENYFETKIFKPLGMKHTGISYRQEEKLVEAMGYTGYMDVKPDELDQWLLNIAFGAGYLCSTAEDLYLWDVALQEGKVVSKESLEEIFGLQAVVGDRFYYGYGWFIYAGGDYGQVIYHGGNTDGFTSENALYPDQKVNIILLTNKAHAELTGIRENLMKILMGNDVPSLEPRKSFEISESKLDQYVGYYQGTGNGLSIHIENESDQLILYFAGMIMNLAAESETELYSRDYELDLEVDLDENGKVSSVFMKAFGAEYHFKAATESEGIGLSEEQLMKYVGTYKIEGVFNFDIFIKEGSLMMQAEGQPEFEVIPLTETKFEASLYGVVIEFDNKDLPTICTISQGGQELIGTKLEQ